MKKEETLKNVLDSIVLLDILEKYSSENKKIDKTEISKIVKEKYKKNISEKRVIEIVAFLREQVGYKVFQFPDGYVKREDEKLDMETLNLMVSRVAKTTYAKSETKQELIKKTTKMISEMDFIQNEIDKIKDIKKKNLNKYGNKIINKIYKAIKGKNKITFNYKTKSMINTYKKHKVIPLYIMQNNNEYYLIATEKKEDYKYFKIERIEELEVLDEKHNLEVKDVNEFLNTTISIFNSPKEEVTFNFKKSKLDEIIDAFGTNKEIVPMTENTYAVTVVESIDYVKSSLVRILDSIEIVSPTNLKMEVEYLLYKAEQGEV